MESDDETQAKTFCNEHLMGEFILNGFIRHSVHSSYLMKSTSLKIFKLLKIFNFSITFFFTFNFLIENLIYLNSLIFYIYVAAVR